MRLNFFLIFLFFTAFSGYAQNDFHLFLVGDAGENEITGETLDSLKSKLLQNPNSAIVFMGDNSYKNILPGIEGFKGFDNSRVTENKLKSQLDILNGYKGSVYFVPGNHDWWNRTNCEKGKMCLQMEESFIETNLAKNNTIANPNETFLPKNGSPGPASVELDNKKVRLVCIDTYWLILLGFKENPKANIALSKVFYHSLDSVLSLAKSMHQQVVVVAHHPVYSSGKVISKKLKHPYFFGRIKQNFKTFPSYDSMIVHINAILQKYPGIFYASGHIHALQFHSVNGVNYIISGAGSKTHRTSKKEQEKEICLKNDFERWNEKGFFELNFYKNKPTDARVYFNNGREFMIIEPQNQ